MMMMMTMTTHKGPFFALLVVPLLLAVVPWAIVVSACLSDRVVDLVDPNGGTFVSGNYLSNSDCKWLISSSQDSAWVNLYFTSFSTQFLSDWVTIYDGPTIFDNVILRYSGNSVPINTLIQSSGRQMLVRLTSDGNVEGPGFNATYNFADPCSSADLAIGMDTRNITFRKLVYPNQPITCVWNIHNPSNSFVHLFLASVQLAPLDVLDVYNGLIQNPGAELLESITSEQIPSQAPIIANSGNMSLVLTHSSGGSYSPITSLFRATYQAGNCRGRVNVFGDQGRITDGTSDNHPYPIQQHGVCQWLIKPSTAKSLSLTFNSFDLAPDSVLRVYDGAFSNGLSPLIGSWTNDSAPLINSQPVLYSNGIMLVEFESGNSNNYHTGFDMSYAAADSCNAPFVFSQPWGEISHSPRTTSKQLNCTWIIDGGALPVQLIFTSLDIPTSAETIEIYDGNSPNRKRAIRGGDPTYPEPIISTSTSLRIVLTGPLDSSGSSFTAVYNTAICRRQVNIKSENGSFLAVTSTYYPDSSDCSFLITPAVSENPITLSFSEFRTEEGKDILYIYDGPFSIPSKLLLSWSGSTPPPRLYSTAPSMLLRLVTDGSGATGSGFVTEFTTNFPSEPLSVELYYARDLNRFHIFWQEPDSKVTISQYEIQIDKDDGVGWQVVATVHSSQLSYGLDWEVVAGRYYATRIRALDTSNIPGPWAVARNLLQDVPGVPEVFYAYGTGVGSIALDISVPHNGYSPLLSYTIEIYNLQNDTFYELITTPYIKNTIHNAHGNVSSFVSASVNGLSPASNYLFRMSSKNALGRSAYLEMSASTKLLSIGTVIQIYATAFVPLVAVLVVVMLVCFTLVGVFLIFLSYKLVIKPHQMQAHMELPDLQPESNTDPTSTKNTHLSAQQEDFVDEEDIQPQM